MTKNIMKILTLLVIFLGTYFSIYHFPLLSLVDLPIGRMRSIIALLGTVGACWFIWEKMGINGPKSLISNIAAGGIILGSLGFALGFFGPIIFAPTANQGPLLGIFITGPIGFLLGLIGGGVVWYLKKKN